jgi:hypothetical protein
MKNLLPPMPFTRSQREKRFGVRRPGAAFDHKCAYSPPPSHHRSPNNTLTPKSLSTTRLPLLTSLQTISLVFALTLPLPTNAEEITSQTFEETTAITVGNFIYAGNKTAICFADRFLAETANKTNLNINPKYVPTKLAGEAAGSDLFASPFSVFSGEGTFSLTDLERKNLREYLTRGGFVLASPGCSDKAWNVSFRRELKAIFPDMALTKVPMTHPIFGTVAKIPRLTVKSGKIVLLEGLMIDGRLALVYSQDGLNDVAKAKGCCCCGGDEVRQCLDVNINILTYALIY